MTLLDLLVLIVVIAAAVAGFRRGGGAGSAGAASLLGLLVGAGVGVPIGTWLTGLDGGDPTARTVLLVAGIVLGLVLGAVVGGWLGRMLGRVLVRSRLGALDRVLGALAGAGAALLVIWAVTVVTPALIGPTALEPVTTAIAAAGGHSVVVGDVGSTLARTVPATQDIRQALGA